jgi:pimeloyl-ACP methyl ester carboxylesterase
MFSCFHGTATDTSHLISHLSSYILHTPSSPPITQHLCLGVSLGGHAAWHCILSDPRITAAVVVIGCPDYTRLLTDRARLSKRAAYTQSTPPGSTFLGSQDFPNALMDAVAQYDPAGLLLPGSFDPQFPAALVPEPGKAKVDRMRVLIRERLGGKQILNLYGKSDKLVPYAAGEPFLRKFKEVLAQDASLDTEFEDVGLEGVGHKFDAKMAEKATAWICAVLEREGRVGFGSKI